MRSEVGAAHCWPLRERDIFPLSVRSSKHLNDLIEHDHRGIQSRLGPMVGFKDFVAAQITLAGVELVHAAKTAPEIWNAVLAG